MTAERLEQLLTADGWPLERLDEDTWRSGFRLDGGEAFRFFVRLTKDWLFLTIVTFVVAPEGDVHALLRCLLELNRQITFVKFALEGRDVVLTA